MSGKVVIIDGKVGVISSDYGTGIKGIYLDGTDFAFFRDRVNIIPLDENLNKYIDRLVHKFGKLRVNSK